ncbi:MAG: FGGY family carbohydrate kinase [Elusimicrobiota bacterium]
MKPVIIALDQGSSSSRALAFGPDGRIVARAQFSVKTTRPRLGWVEQDALELAQTQEKALDSVLSGLPKSRAVIGLGIASQRSTIVLWDSRTGRPVAPALSWQDNRAAKNVESLQNNREAWRRRTGLYPAPYYSAPKLSWMFHHQSRLRGLAKSGRLMAGPVASFILWRLSRGSIFASDPTLAQRTWLMNIRTLTWDDDLLDLFEIPRNILPTILPSAGLWGLIRRRGLEIPVMSCLGDQQAAVAGLGASSPGAVVANYGTGAFLLRNAGTQLKFIPGLLSSVGWKVAGQDPFYFEEGTVNAAGAAMDWLSSLGLIKTGSDLDRLCRMSTRRVWVLPALGGLGAPFWDSRVKALFAGLDGSTTAPDIVRAAAESIAFLIVDIASAMRLAGRKINEIRASGGVSRSNMMMQFQADILGVPVRRLSQPDATALGTALLALRAHDPPWSKRLEGARDEKIFMPQLSASAVRDLRNRWSRLVEAARELSAYP